MLFWVLMAGIQTPVLSQSEQVPQLEYKGKGLIFFLAKNLKYPKELDNCEKSTTIAAIRFKLDAQGRISFVEAVGSIGDSTKKHLKEVIMQTNGLWKPRYVNGKAVASRLIIQPIIYNLTDCDKYVQYSPYEGVNEAMQQLFSVDKNGQDCTINSLVVVQGIANPIRKSQY